MFAIPAVHCLVTFSPKAPGQMAVSRLIGRSLAVELESVSKTRIQGASQPGLIPFLGSYYNLYRALAITQDWQGIEKLQSRYLTQDYVGETGDLQVMSRFSAINSTTDALKHTNEVTKFEPHVDEIKINHSIAVVTVSWRIAGAIAVDSSSYANFKFGAISLLPLPPWVGFEARITVNNTWVNTDSRWRLKETRTQKIWVGALGQTASTKYPGPSKTPHD